MIANRGLHRSQPIWITLHRSTVPLRIVHDRFSCSASLRSSPSFSPLLSIPLPSFYFFWSIWHSFTTDSTLVRTLLRCLEANIAEAICYTRGVNRARNFWIRIGRCFCPWNRYIPSARRSARLRLMGFMAYGRVLLTRFEWMHGFCADTLLRIEKYCICRLIRKMVVRFLWIQSCL